MTSSTTATTEYCSDAFIFGVRHMKFDPFDPINRGIDLAEVKYLQDKLMNNYHLVEIDANECPNFDMAYEIFNSRVYEASEGAIETGEEVVLLTRGNYDDNFEDALPTDKPVIEDL
jgi:hypothetical protein